MRDLCLQQIVSYVDKNMFKNYIYANVDKNMFKNFIYENYVWTGPLYGCEY
jgi:hypothetical protein